MLKIDAHSFREIVNGVRQCDESISIEYQLLQLPASVKKKKTNQVRSCWLITWMWAIIKAVTRTCRCLLGSFRGCCLRRWTPPVRSVFRFRPEFRWSQLGCCWWRVCGVAPTCTTTTKRETILQAQHLKIICHGENVLQLPLSALCETKYRCMLGHLFGLSRLTRVVRVNTFPW